MKNWKAKIGAAIAAASFAVAGAASAALPDSIDTSLSDLQSDGLALVDKIWPVALAIVGGFTLLRLGKRAVRSAT